MELYNTDFNLVMPSLLEGSRVMITPLDKSHTAELYETAKDESIWKHYTFIKMGGHDRFQDFIMSSVNAEATGREFTFTITDKEKNKMIGGTSFLDIVPESRSLEIGRTWIAPYLQGTGFNTECKYS